MAGRQEQQQRGFFEILWGGDEEAATPKKGQGTSIWDSVMDGDEEEAPRGGSGFLHTLFHGDEKSESAQSQRNAGAKLNQNVGLASSLWEGDERDNNGHDGETGGIFGWFGGEEQGAPAGKPQQPAKKTPNFFVEAVTAIGAIGTTVSDIRKEHRKLTVPPSATPQARPALKSHIPRRQEIDNAIKKRDEIHTMPRSSAFYHPDVIQARAALARIPKLTDQIRAAEQAVNAIHAAKKRVEALQEAQRRTQLMRTELAKYPLTTAGWNGYQVWKKQLERRVPFDTSVGLWRYTGRRLLERGTIAFTRWFDNLLVTFPPRIQRGTIPLQIDDQHREDQVIFDGTNLHLSNPSSSEDIQVVTVDQIRQRILFGVEGPRMLQTIANLRGQTGVTAPLLLFRRGMFIALSSANGKEYVRVPMKDPEGFQLALSEMIALCLPPSPLAPDSAAPKVPPIMSIRDLFEFPEDSPDFGRRKSSNGPKSPTDPNNPTDDGGFLRRDEFNEWRRETFGDDAQRRLKTGRSNRGDKANGEDNEDIVDGEFRVE